MRQRENNGTMVTKTENELFSKVRLGIVTVWPVENFLCPKDRLLGF
jgi:hypothetical protein